MLEIGDIALLFLFALLCRVVWIQVDANRIARRAAKKHCLKYDVQFLDQSVVLHSFRIQRSRSTLIALNRVYTFEFASIGDQRYKGWVHMLGYRISNIELEPYKIG